MEAALSELVKHLAMQAEEAAQAESVEALVDANAARWEPVELALERVEAAVAELELNDAAAVPEYEGDLGVLEPE